MSKKKNNYHDFESLHLEDNTPETKFLSNNIDNFNDHMDLLRGPMKILENNALMGVFSGKKEFEGTPDEASILDMRMLDKILGKVLIEMEGLVKAFARHGKEAIVQTDTYIHTMDRRTKKQEGEPKRLTALENIVQGAVIGYWLEMLTTIRHEKSHKRTLLNGLLKDDNKDESLYMKDDEEMDKFLAKADMLEQIMESFKNEELKELGLPKIFPNPRDLAEAFWKHNEDGKDIMEEVSKRMDKYCDDLEEIDKAIQLKKIEDKVIPLLAAIKDTGKGII